MDIQDGYVIGLLRCRGAFKGTQREGAACGEYLDRTTASDEAKLPNVEDVEVPSAERNQERCKMESAL